MNEINIDDILETPPVSEDPCGTTPGWKCICTAAGDRTGACSKQTAEKSGRNCRTTTDSGRACGRTDGKEDGQTTSVRNRD